jgi:single-strand DNA-binding protein
MSGNAQISFVGNLGGDPEVRFTPSGAAVVNFSVAVVERRKNQEGGWDDGETTWYRCNAWRTLAENIAESLTKGTRVVVVGTLKSRSYETKDGGRGLSWEVDVDAVGPELRFATARVQRAERSGGQTGGWEQGGYHDQQSGQARRSQGGGGQYGGRPQGGGGRPADDPWGQPPQGGGGYGQQGFTDEPPFLFPRGQMFHYA